MQIIDVKYLKFKDAHKLSKYYDSNTVLGRYTVQFKDAYVDLDNVFQNIYHELKAAFPSFVEHECCHDVDVDSKSEHNIIEYGSHMDIPHLLEHLVIDILATIEPERRFSGTTCQYENEHNKFDIFINIQNPKLALFAFHMAWSTISSIIAQQTLTKMFRNLVQIAAYIINFQGKNIQRNSLQHKFQVPVPVIEQALLLLEEFALISEYNDEEILI